MPRRQKPKYPRGTKAIDVLAGLDLRGKTFFITGANAGIGFETARALALRNAHVVIGCRSMERAQSAVNKIKAEKADADIDVLPLDNSSLKSVEECAAAYKSRNWPLHCLILNAGVVNPPKPFTDDGFEGTFQINHLAHFYLTQLLLPVLIASKPSRIVVVSSDAHRTPPSNFAVTEEMLCPKNLNGTMKLFKQYCTTKLCNVLFANGLDEKLKGKGVRTNSLHPGVVYTEIGRNFGITKWFNWLYPKTVYPEAGAATSVYCGAHPDLEDVGGKYYVFCEEIEASPKARDKQLENQLFDLSYQMLERATQKTVDHF